MPLYFFHVMDGRANIDLDGTSLDSVADARREAVHLAGAILVQDVTSLAQGHPWQMTAADAAGDVVFTLKFEADRGQGNES